MPKLFVVTGEQSGDRHAALMLHELKDKVPSIEYYGVVGPALRKEQVQEVAASEDLAVMGLSDVIWSLPRLIHIFYKVRDSILKLKSEVVLMVDAVSFNLRLAKALRKKGYKGKIVQYISPTVWAWGAKRKYAMADTLDLLMTIYPFEKSHYEGTGLRVEYVGNPSVANMANVQHDPDWRTSAGLPGRTPLISIFPGSRVGEVKRNLSCILKSLEISDLESYALVISSANQACRKLIEDQVKGSKLKFHVLPTEKILHEIMSESRAAIAKSGTVTLELALHACPTIVPYKLSKLNEWMAKYIMKLNLPHYCIVNILAEERVFPEFIAEPPSPENISVALKKLLRDGRERENTLRGCRKVKNILTENHSSNGAGLLMEILGCQ